ncbi:MAG: SpoIIE family protein phosphatase [Cytophagales bacterium]|nr:SpoIIE family protein phosphatase [Cytophagales bacterium]
MKNQIGLLIILSSLIHLQGFTQIISLSDNQEYIVTDIHYVLTDSGATTNWQTAISSSEFVPAMQVTISEEVMDYWYKFELVNNIGHDEVWMLNFDQWLEVDFYYDQGRGWNTKHTGHMLGKHERDYLQANRNFIRLDLEQGDTVQCLVHLRTGLKSIFFPTSTSFKVAPYKIIKDQEVVTRFWVGAFAGIFAVMLLYNLFLFFSVREKAYVWYIFILLFEVGATLQNFGYVIEIFPEWYARIFGTVDVLMSSLFGICIIGFTNTFLQIKANLKIWYKVLIGLSFLLILITIPALGGQVFVAYNISSLIGLLLFIILIIVISLSVRKGVPSSGIFLIAFLSFIVGLFLYLSKELGALPTTTFTTFAMQIGSALMVVLFAIALANKVNLLKRENEKAQAKIIEHLKENEELQTKVNRELEAKVKERTLELEDTNKELLVLNEEISQQNEEIMMQRDYISEKNQSLEKAFHVIEKKNQDITSSINYAKRIQSAMLPPVSHMKAAFEDFFLFFKPRDIVSGDFYWFSTMDTKVVIAAIDCTGHGVPGAFMSLVGDGFLNQIINIRGITNPSLILSELDRSLQKQLNEGKEGKTADGMDMALCVIDKERGTLEFSGAKNDLVYHNGEKLTVIRGSRFSIAGKNQDQKKEFSTHSISFEPSMCFYLYTDGFKDQFGGPNNKKFMNNQLLNLINQIALRPMQEQKTIIEEEFNNWKGISNQIDDVLVIGFKIK